MQSSKFGYVKVWVFEVRFFWVRSTTNSVHDGKKDHKCTSCSKTFSDTGNLKAHINSIHDGQKEENDVHGRYDNGKIFIAFWLYLLTL